MWPHSAPHSAQYWHAAGGVGVLLQGRDQTLLTLSTRQLPGQSVRSQTDLRTAGRSPGPARPSSPGRWEFLIIFIFWPHQVNINTTSWQHQHITGNTFVATRLCCTISPRRFYYGNWVVFSCANIPHITDLTLYWTRTDIVALERPGVPLSQ